MSTPEFIRDYSDERGSFTAIRVGPLKSRITQKLADIKDHSGTILDPEHLGEKKDWEIEGIITLDDYVYILGKKIPCKNNLTQVLEKGPEAAYSQILSFIKVFASYSANKHLFLRGLFLSSVLALETGEYLLLPPLVQDLQLSLLDDQERLKGYNLYRHPGLKDEQGLLFSLWNLLYYVSFKTLPYGDLDDGYTKKLLAGLVQDPRISCPDCSESTAKAFTSLLSTSGCASLLSAGYRTLLNALNFIEKEKELWKDEKTPSKALIRRYQGKLKRHSFFLKLKQNSGKIIFTSIILLAVLSIPTAMIVSSLQPLKTAGMNSEEVLTAYFTALNTQDSELLEDCYAKNYGKDHVSQITNLGIIRKIRMANEKRDPLIPLDTWIQEGKPELSGNIMLFGYSNIRIEKLETNETKASYRVRSTFYSNLAADRDPDSSDAVEIETQEQDQHFVLDYLDHTWQIITVEDYTAN